MWNRWCRYFNGGGTGAATDVPGLLGGVIWDVTAGGTDVTSVVTGGGFDVTFGNRCCNRCFKR